MLLVDPVSVLIGLAIALALAVWFWRRKWPTTRRGHALRALFVLAAMVAGVAGSHYGMKLLDDSPGGPMSVDRTLIDLKRTPLLRLVIEDVPGAEARLRTALEDDRRQPRTQGTTRAYDVIVELRSNHIVPALRAADDDSALAAIAARVALIRHLQAVNLTACHEFASSGLQRVDRLDARAQQLFADTLDATERAYRSGRDGKSAPRPIASGGEVNVLLIEAGFQPDDFEKAKRIGEIADVEACALAARLNTAPQQLAPANRGALARHLLSSQ